MEIMVVWYGLTVRYATSVGENFGNAIGIIDEAARNRRGCNVIHLCIAVCDGGGQPKYKDDTNVDNNKRCDNDNSNDLTIVKCKTSYQFASIFATSVYQSLKTAFLYHSFTYIPRKLQQNIPFYLDV